MPADAEEAIEAAIAGKFSEWGYGHQAQATIPRALPMTRRTVDPDKGRT